MRTEERLQLNRQMNRYRSGWLTAAPIPIHFRRGSAFFRETKKFLPVELLRYVGRDKVTNPQALAKALRRQPSILRLSFLVKVATMATGIDQ